MNAKYVTAVKYLEIAGNLGRGDRIDDNIFITNSRTEITSLLPKIYMPIIGVLEWSFINDSKVVIWGRPTFDEDQDPLQVLNGMLYKVQGFLNSIWLFVDNSIDTEIGFLFYDKDGIPTASSSYINFSPCAADGTSPKISINREQLREIRKFHREHMYYEAFGPHPVTKVVKAEGRLSRALYFIGAARGSRDLGVKMMHYCTALETLFSTSQAELAHQLSERLAHFIESKPEIGYRLIGL